MSQPKVAVIGLGEVGRAIYNILIRTYPDIWGYDPKYPSPSLPNEGVHYLHICIPYSKRFVSIVKRYQKQLSPSVTIIHSTVPVGTTKKIRGAVHSPVLGRHAELSLEMRRYDKWIGGPSGKADQAFLHLREAGFRAKITEKSQHTELLKLLCLAKYGINIAFAQYSRNLCRRYKLSYSRVKEWDRNYNTFVTRNLQRPIMDPPGRRIGGHCVTQNVALLDAQFPNQLLKEVLRYA